MKSKKFPSFSAEEKKSIDREIFKGDTLNLRPKRKEKIDLGSAAVVRRRSRAATREPEVATVHR